MSFISYPIQVNVESAVTRHNLVCKPAALRVKQQVESGCFAKPHYTARDIDKFNSLNMIQLLVWYDEASLNYDGKMLTLKEHTHCIVLAEGIYDTETYRMYQVIDALHLNETEIRDNYDAVFHLVTAAKGAEEFYTLSNNNARTETPEQAAIQDDKLIYAWTGHPHLRIIDNSYDFEGKMRKLILLSL